MDIKKHLYEFFKSLYQKHIPIQADYYWLKFSVPIGIAREPSQVYLHTDGLPWNINNMTVETVVLVFFVYFFVSE